MQHPHDKGYRKIFSFWKIREIEPVDFEKICKKTVSFLDGEPNTVIGD